MHARGHNDALAVEDDERRRGGGREMNSESKERKKNEKRDLFLKPPSSLENVSAVKQHHCEETKVSTRAH